MSLCDVVVEESGMSGMGRVVEGHGGWVVCFVEGCELWGLLV